MNQVVSQIDNATNGSATAQPVNEVEKAGLSPADRMYYSDQFLVVNDDTHEELMISKGELLRHVSRLSGIEKTWRMIHVTDGKFRQIKAARAE